MEAVKKSEVEQNLLACVFKKPELIYEIDIKVDDFLNKMGSNHNRALYKILKYIAQKKDIKKAEFDVATVTNYIEQFGDVKEDLKNVFKEDVKEKTTKYIDTLKGIRIDPNNIDLYEQEIKKINATNEMIKKNKLMNIELMEHHSRYSLSDILRKAETTTLEIVNKYANTDSEPELIGEGMMEDYMNRVVNEREFTGYSSPFKNLDKFTSGIQRKGSVTVFNAPTGVGKSIILKNIVKHIGIDLEEAIYWGANEMTKQEQKDRLLAEVTGVAPEIIEGGIYNKEGNERLRERVEEGIKKIEKAEIYIDQVRGYDIDTLKRRARYYKTKYNIKGFVWDYVKRSSAFEQTNTALRHWLGDIVTQFKEEIADKLGIFVITATQAKTYQVDFASESQDIERYSTTFIILKELTKKEKRENLLVGDYGFFVKKNRYGKTHGEGEIIPLAFDKTKLLFKEAN